MHVLPLNLADADTGVRNVQPHPRLTRGEKLRGRHTLRSLLLDIRCTGIARVLSAIVTCFTALFCFADCSFNYTDAEVQVRGGGAACSLSRLARRVRCM
jgi:hypothetical protein